MQIKAIALAIAAILLPALANAVTYSHVESVRVGSKTVVPGDSVDKIADQGEPDRKIDLINDFGVKKGEEWIFIRSGGHSATVLRVNNSGTVFMVLDMLGL